MLGKNQLASCLLGVLFVSAQDPGFPVKNPTISYWQTPPNKDVADAQSSTLPASVDVVIIGSGMTGTSIAHQLLKNGSQTAPLRIAMLEARQACSGATGRNGGHIRPSSYEEYAHSRENVPKEEAAKITRLRSAHVEALIAAANELDDEGREASEARKVDSIDGFFDRKEYMEALQQLDVLKADIPDIGSQFTSFGEQDTRKFSLLQEAVGMITGTTEVAGAIWPYRFVTHTLKALLRKYPSFSLDTNTPAHIVLLSNSTSAPYIVVTARGNITARHVIYASNAWTPHFVPKLQGKISGGRLHMSAQLGGASLPKAGEWPSYTNSSSLATGRAWSLFRNGLDYIVQMPRNGEYMFGGGEGNSKVERILMDDSLPPDHGVSAYLNGALPSYFGYTNWGAERTDFPASEDNATYPGRTKRVWTGIEGISWDGRPLVGKIPTSITERQVPESAKAAEWVSAAYDGEGMCFAWLCGQALGQMLLFTEKGEAVRNPDWFPNSLLLTEERIKNNGTERPAAPEKRGSRVSHLKKRGIFAA